MFCVLLCELLIMFSEKHNNTTHTTELNANTAILHQLISFQY
jgi:hypothetical protein